MLKDGRIISPILFTTSLVLASVLSAWKIYDITTWTALGYNASLQTLKKNVTELRQEKAYISAEYQYYKEGKERDFKVMERRFKEMTALFSLPIFFIFLTSRKRPRNC